MLSRKDFGRAVFAMIRSGVPDLCLSVPSNPALCRWKMPVDNEVMLCQRKWREFCKRRLSQHNNGHPIRNWMK